MSPGRSPAARVGILGSGHISDYHIAGLQEAGAEVVAIFSRTEAKVREQALRYRIPHPTTDYRSVLARDDIGTVVIATPDFTHEALAVEAAAAGKTILLQKPMARTSSECLHILEAADKGRVSVYVSFMHRYVEEVVALSTLLAQKALGRIGWVRQRNATPGADWASWFYSKEKVGGGVVLQLGVHGIDLLRQLFGEIVAVRATTAMTGRSRILADGSTVIPDNEDLAFATYRFASGMLAVHEMSDSEIAGTDRFRMEIYGEHGTAWLRTDKGRLAVFSPRYFGRPEWVRPTLPPPNGRLTQHSHFVAMVRGEAPPDSSARDGLASVLVAEAIYRSAAAGDWEDIRWP